MHSGLRSLKTWMLGALLCLSAFSSNGARAEDGDCEDTSIDGFGNSVCIQSYGPGVFAKVKAATVRTLREGHGFTLKDCQLAKSARDPKSFALEGCSNYPVRLEFERPGPHNDLALPVIRVNGKSLGFKNSDLLASVNSHFKDSNLDRTLCFQQALDCSEAQFIPIQFYTCMVPTTHKQYRFYRLFSWGKGDRTYYNIVEYGNYRKTHVKAGTKRVQQYFERAKAPAFEDRGKYPTKINLQLAIGTDDPKETVLRARYKSEEAVEGTEGIYPRDFSDSEDQYCIRVARKRTLDSELIAKLEEIESKLVPAAPAENPIAATSVVPPATFGPLRLPAGQ